VTGPVARGHGGCGSGRPEMRFSRAMMARTSPRVEFGHPRRAKPAWISRSRSPAARGAGASEGACVSARSLARVRTCNGWRRVGIPRRAGTSTVGQPGDRTRCERPWWMRERAAGDAVLESHDGTRVTSVEDEYPRRARPAWISRSRSPAARDGFVRGALPGVTHYERAMVLAHRLLGPRPA